MLLKVCNIAGVRYPNGPELEKERRTGLFAGLAKGLVLVMLAFYALFTSLLHTNIAAPFWVKPLGAYRGVG